MAPRLLRFALLLACACARDADVEGSLQTSGCGCATGDGGALFLLGGLALRRRRR